MSLQKESGRGARAERGLALLVGFIALIAAAGVAFTHLSPPKPISTPQSVVDSGPFDLRLSGSAELGDALVPALAEAWLTARGAETVDVSQPKTNGTPRPERVLAAKLGEHTTRIDVRAFGDQSGSQDLATGRADIALLAEPLQPPEPAAAVVIGLSLPGANGGVRRLMLLPAKPSSAAAKAFIAFAISGAGEAIVARAGFTPPPVKISGQAPRRP